MDLGGRDAIFVWTLCLEGVCRNTAKRDKNEEQDAINSRFEKKNGIKRSLNKVGLASVIKKGQWQLIAR